MTVINKLKQSSLTALLFPLILIMMVIQGCSQRNKLFIAEDGVAFYQVVIPTGSDSIVELAAGELADYLLKVSGASVQVVPQQDADPDMQKIFVGVPLSDQTDPYRDPSGVKILNSGEDIFICGGSSDATMNGVYIFLENYMGIRWFAPGAELVPANPHPVIEIPLDFSYTPDITTRTVHSRLFYDNPEFARRMKVTTEAFPGYVPDARVHTFHRFMPEEKFFMSHPEYYALRSGRRIPTQLCLTNPDVLRIVKDSVEAYFNRFPGASVISVSQDDNTLYCECEECSNIDKEEASHAGTMIRFVNQVAASFPDKTISTLAYQYTRKPPVTVPASNVLITLCSIECDRSAPIIEKCSDFASDLSGWKEKTSNIRIWDYTTQFTNFLAPFPNIHTLAPNIRFFRDNNAKWIFEQHSNNPSELFELRSYLMAKLLWDPDLDPDEIILEFTEGYYGEAGVYVRNYIEDITREMENDPDFFLFLYGDPSQGFGSFLSPEKLDYYNQLYDMAEETVANKPVYLKRIQEARLSVDYATLEACRANLNESYSLTGKGIDTGHLLKDFSDVCKGAGITLMNEMGYSVDEYTSGYKFAVERAGLRNIAAGKEVSLLTTPKKYAGEDPATITNGALGGASFYSNWLGFEGNDMIAIIDLGNIFEIDTISTAFLQVTNHIVFFPESVSFSVSTDNNSFKTLSTLKTGKPLSPSSKVNDIENFDIVFSPVNARFVRIEAKNIKIAPDWHNAAGLPAWIFCDEVIIN